MGAHARFSPSAANRLIHCPPSLVLGEAFQEEESPYAAEGSAGHALAEHLIKKHLKQQTRRPVSDYYSDDLLEADRKSTRLNSSHGEQSRMPSSA